MEINLALMLAVFTDTTYFRFGVIRLIAGIFVFCCNFAIAALPIIFAAAFSHKRLNHAR
jgi:hypothetical protein